MGVRRKRSHASARRLFLAWVRDRDPLILAAGNSCCMRRKRRVAQRLRWGRSRQPSAGKSISVIGFSGSEYFAAPGRALTAGNFSKALVRAAFQHLIPSAQKQIGTLGAGLQKVSAQLEVKKAAPQTVLNDNSNLRPSLARYVVQSLTLLLR